MSDSAKSDIDRNLLFGVIALQDDFIDQAQFTDVCAGWAMRMDRPLAELLIERGWINADDRAEIERKLVRKLKKHRDDPHATLASMADAELREALQSIAQPDVRQSLQRLAPATGHRLVETLVPPVDQRSSLRYTLTRMHAQGGLGKIWIARDTDLNREVALKEIRVERSTNPDAWRRFMKEAQVTGQLEHPNIVPVYELARRKEDDQPFYTMRFVRGGTLRQAIAEFHAERGHKPANRLELQRRLLEPFIKVCQAIGYAHARGVIHRDLKPENVVLGNHGEVIVLDWGLAKILDDTDNSPAPTDQRVTVTAEADTKATQGAIGTPAYMAPEQALGNTAQIDTRTDIYGLGGILYEILTKKPPADGETLPDVLSKVTSGKIARARSLEPTVSKPLDAICAKALAFKPDDRYQSAEELAEDVRRWTVDEPVSVYRDPPLVQAARWARRHRTSMYSLGALLGTTLVGLTVGLVLINSERAKTETQRKLAVANATQALRNLHIAQDAADGLLSEVADVDLAEIPQMEVVRKRLLEKASVSYDQLLANKAENPLARWGSGRALVRLGDIQSLLGDGAAARKSYDEGIDILETLAKADPQSADYARDLARGKHGLGVLLKDENRFQPSEEAMREAIRLRETLAKSAGATPQDEQALADSQYQLGAMLARQGGKSSRDAQAYQTALAIVDALVKRTDGRPELRTQRARYQNNLGRLQYALGEVDKAEATFRGIIDSIGPLVDSQQPLPGPRWQYARAANNLAKVLAESRHLAEAQSLFTKSSQLLESLAAEFPSVVAYRAELASVVGNLGAIERAAQNDQRAEVLLNQAIALLENLGRENPRVPAYRHRAEVLRLDLNEIVAQNNPDGADKGMRQALANLNDLNRDFPDTIEFGVTLVRAHYQLATLLWDAKRPDDAVLELGQALRLGRSLLEQHPNADALRANLVMVQDALAQNYLDMNRLADAIQAAEQIASTRPGVLESYLRAAALLAECAARSAAQPGGGDLSDDCARKAVNLLNDAFKRNLLRSRDDVLSMQTLDTLRDRADFRQLLDRLSEGPIVR